MAKHQVQRLGDEYVVVDDKQAILHKFPSQGEAELQVIALAEKEKAEKLEAKEEAKAEKEAAKEEAKNESHGRHR